MLLLDLQTLPVARAAKTKKHKQLLKQTTVQQHAVPEHRPEVQEGAGALEGGKLSMADQVCNS